MNLRKRAEQVIESNWKDGFTIPTAKLYPFQWMWDSGFVAMGTAQYDLNKSIEEIDKMFSGQWENGMLPHILFHSQNESTYFPNYDFWNSNVNSGAPDLPKTSGITQPPVFGFVLNELWKAHAGNDLLKAFIQTTYDKVVLAHRFLYTERNCNGDGLFFIFHPWESGRDNSPIWDQPLSKITVDPSKLPAYERRDTKIADASERPTRDQYDRYVYLLEMGKSRQYKGGEIVKDSPFVIQDCMMNAILIKSNEALIELGAAFGKDTAQLKEWNELSLANFNARFWNEELGTFVSYDYRNEQQMRFKEIGGFVPLFAGSATKEQASKIATLLQSYCDRGYYLCPSFDVDDPLFDSKRYWRGPVWPQMNWMISKGLADYGYKDLSETVRRDLIELVEKHGFHEYFESEKAKAAGLTKGYGGSNFSWTASVIINFLAADA